MILGEILKNKHENKVDVLIGFNKEDGQLFSTRFLKDSHKVNFFLENLDLCGPIYLLGKDKDSIGPNDVASTKQIVQAYSETDANLTFDEITDLFTDAVFGLGTEKLADYLIRNDRKVFKYLFAYRGIQNSHKCSSSVYVY